MGDTTENFIRASRWMFWDKMPSIPQSFRSRATSSSSGRYSSGVRGPKTTRKMSPLMWTVPGALISAAM